MNKKTTRAAATPILLTFLLTLTFLVSCNTVASTTVQAETAPEVYVGIDLAYGSVADAKALIGGALSNYTNFFVLGQFQTSFFSDSLNDTLQYAHDNGFYFVSLPVHIFWPPDEWGQMSDAQWFEYIETHWGDRLLGWYETTSSTPLDEPGGKQLDGGGLVTNADNYNSAASQYVNQLIPQVVHTPSFTSDYGLFWYDYKAGFDTVFAQFIKGSNNQLSIALCRGAAQIMNRDWGVIITYGGPSFNETGAELFNDMVLAYDNGAKYIVVFNSNFDHTGPSLNSEHFQAMRQFWQYIQTNPRKSIPANQRAAFVLPKDYGVGLRWRDEKIWGIFEADNVSLNLYDDTKSLLERYGAGLDVVYDDGMQNTDYSKLIYWNTNNPIPSTNPSPSPTQSQSPSPTPTQSLLPSQEPTSLPNQQSTLQEAYYVVALVAAVVIVAAVALLLRKRVRRQR